MLREKKLVLGAVVAVAILLTGVGMFKASAGSENPSILISGGSFSNVFFGAGAQAPAAPEMTFGSAEGDTTVFTAVSTTEDVGVGRKLYVVSTSTFSGDAIGVAKTYSATMSSSATTTACFITPSISSRRVITAVGVVDRGSAASVGSVNWTVGTSTASGVAPTGVKLVSNVLTRVSGVDVLSTTSTVQSVYSSVNPGESIIFQTGTTTNAGACWVVLN